MAELVSWSGPGLHGTARGSLQTLGGCPGGIQLHHREEARGWFRLQWERLKFDRKKMFRMRHLEAQKMLGAGDGLWGGVDARRVVRPFSERVRIAVSRIRLSRVLCLAVEQASSVPVCTRVCTSVCECV